MVSRAPATVMDGEAGDKTTKHGFGAQPGRRVLYVVSMFPCWSETFIVREIHALVRRGVDVRVVSLRRGEEAFVQSDAELLLDRVFYPEPPSRNFLAALDNLVKSPFTTLKHPLAIVHSLWRSPFSMAKSLVAWYRTMGLLERIRKFSPDHVHAHWATYASTAAMVAADHIGAPFSFTAHAHDIYLEDQLMPVKLRRAAFVATISNFNRRYLRDRYPAAGDARIEIVHCGVARRDAATDTSGDDVFRILSVGRLDAIKGFPVLLAACSRLVERGVKFRCEIIGDGPLREELRTDLRRRELDGHVFMLGALPSQEVEQKLASSDLFVLASQRSSEGNMDGIPVALMEAMASGTPVVSTAVSGIPELVENGRTGLLVPPRDSGALADAIEQLLTDESLRERCVARARQKVRQEFDAETEGERLLGFIQSIPGEKNAQKIADHH